MFIVEERIKAEIRAGKVWELSFSTGLAPEWLLDTEAGARLPETALQGIRSDVKAGSDYGFTFETGVSPDWMFSSEAAAAATFDFAFETEFPQDWLLRTDVKAQKPVKPSFSAIFDPAKRRLDEERLELYRYGKTDHEALIIPVNWYQKDTERTFSLDLWFSRLQLADLADDVRLSAYALGGDNRLGREVVDNGYLEVKLSGQSTYTPLSAGTEFSVGPMWANSKKTLDFRLSIPAAAASIGLSLEFSRGVAYGSIPFGRAVFGEFSRVKREKVLIKLHIMG